VHAINISPYSWEYGRHDVAVPGVICVCHISRAESNAANSRALVGVIIHLPPEN
jgi:hypothetical protein